MGKTTQVISLFVLGWVALAGSAHAEKFVQGGWWCKSAEAYRDAVAQSQGLDAAGLESLKNRLYVRRLCFWMDTENLRQVVTGVRVLETDGELAYVSFAVQQGDQMPGAVRQEQFLQMKIWTARDHITHGDEIEKQ